MSINEHDLDEVLVRIGDEIDRYRASHRPVRLPDVTDQGHRGGNARRLWRGGLLAAAASVVVVAGLWAVASLNPGGGDSATGPTSSELDVPPPAVLTPVVEELLPEGFAVVRETASVPFVVTALGPDGVLIDVRVGLDEAEIVREQVGDTMVPAPAGEMTSDGSIVFTAAGDVISVDAMYGSQPANGTDLSLSFAAVDDIARIAAGMAERLDDTLRSELVSRTSDVNDLVTARLRADVQNTLVQVTGAALVSAGTADPGNFQVTVETPTATQLTLIAIRSSTNVDEGTVRPSPGTVTTTVVVNDWIVQLVDIDSTAPIQLLTDGDIATVLDSIEPIFAEWTNEPTTEPVCATYSIMPGDSLASIAEQQGVALEALEAVNPDYDAALLPGAVLNLPCADPNAVAPANHPVTEPIAQAPEDDNLPYLVIDPIPQGYTFSDSINASYGKDYEPPALLLAWAVDDGAQIPITVGVDNHAEPIPAPAGADLVATDTVTGWVWRTDGVTSAYLQPTDGPVYRLFSSREDAPGDMLIDIVTGLTADGNLTWRGQLPDGIIEVARQERATTMHATTYEGTGGAVTIATLSDLPVNGLTLYQATTVTTDLSILGMNGFAMTTPSSDGGGELVLYWSSGDGPVFSMSATGTDIGVTELIAIAEQSRPATPDQEVEFQ